MDALRDLLEDLTPEHKVIVWAVFKQNYRDIAKVCADLKIEYVTLSGEQSTKEKNDAVEKFKTNPDTKVIIANPQAGGVGVNLQEASYSIFYSRNFSLENDLQAEARNYRGGSEIHEWSGNWRAARDLLHGQVSRRLSGLRPKHDH